MDPSTAPEAPQTSSEIVLIPTTNAKTEIGEESSPTHGSEASIASGGPRTPEGKERSKRNATKHAIFSNVVVLPSESSSDYESLFSALHASFDPVGSLEEILVEKLVTLLWRQRRLLNAESAEIRRRQDFLKWDMERQQGTEADNLARKRADADVDVENIGVKDGLIWHIENPHVLARCLHLLDTLREEVDSAPELSLESAEWTLKRIYGPSNQKHLNDTLYDDFADWCSTAQAEEEERAENGWASPKECKKFAVKAIDSEIHRLKQYRKESSAIEVQRMGIEKLRQSVPDSPALDRLMRYEASLERAFDRTLTQLERIQRQRKGHLVPPPIKVELS